MTIFDYTFLSVLGLSAILGMWRGLASEVLGLVAWVLALVVAGRYAGVASVRLENLVGPHWRMAAAFVLVLIAVLLLMSLVRVLLRRLLHALGLGMTDRVLGAMFGIVRGLAIAVAVVWIGGMVGMSREPWWEQALFAPPLEKVVRIAKVRLPDADSLADKIGFN